VCEGFLRKNCERRFFDLNVSMDLRVAVKMIEVFYDPARFAPGFALGIPIPAMKVTAMKVTAMVFTAMKITQRLSLQ